MFNFKAFAVAALIGATALIAPSAEARPSRNSCGQNNSGVDYCVTLIGSNSVEVLIDDKYNDTVYSATMKCSTGDYRWRANDGFSKASIEATLTEVCNFGA